MAVFPRREIPLDDNGQPLNPALCWSRVADRQVDEVIGLCKGVLADGQVNQGEAEFLLNWLQSNQHCADKWPANVLFPRIRAMLADGVLDDTEEQELLTLLMGITGSPNVNATGTNASATLPFDDPSPRVAFAGEIFCLTGTFACGPRREVEDAVVQRGGAVKKTPCKKTSFLVVGEVGSRDWAHSTFGRKIEKAIELRDGGSTIAIIPEERFFEYLHG
ncbi:BRCT domain-containing protein [Marinobacter oulmenensis]|uniref:NAD-dependent DNA ligase n=1 Tax=Marinobacter oulmenensis TaxID=643747 RepID=A0A840UK35_9GAMM|nr:BRCT domain-containing protein [Marinobacter oulmenensis]MBB5321197.1 NAD-dependent DNA ligase [Marinobacter oulmenensis]